MPITPYELFDKFGTAALTGNASLFVGTGLSRDSGYPLWSELLDEPRKEAGIPEMKDDLPLCAQYYVNKMGLARLEQHMLDKLAKIEAVPGQGHKHIAALPIKELWTTNYDCLLEAEVPEAQVVMSEADLQERRTAWERRIVKMHGSLSSSSPITWKAPPVITREDYEKYQQRHPRMWAHLTAAFVTRSFLFLGFSFSDPNIEVLLRLARTRLEPGAPEHYTVLCRPTDGADKMLYEHQVADLERSGIGVHEISSFRELVPLLGKLARRTRPPQLFVSGSEPSSGAIKSICEAVGSRLAHTPIELASLAGPAGMEVSYAFGRSLRQAGRYDPGRVRLYFRPKGEPPPELTERIGTVFYTDYPQEQLRERVIDESRAMLVIAGAENTAAEVQFARDQGVPVIPVAMSGGSARAAWEAIRQELGSLEYGGRAVPNDQFESLASTDANVVAEAAVKLVRQAMYLDT